MGKMWKEAVVAQFSVFFQHFPGRTDNKPRKYLGQEGRRSGLCSKWVNLEYKSERLSFELVWFVDDYEIWAGGRDLRGNLR